MSKVYSDAQQCFQSFPPGKLTNVNSLLQEALQHLNKKIIVLDDDPTGVQTVHNISVYTDWTVESIQQGFEEKHSMFFILTNSRGFTGEKTATVHREIANNIRIVATALGQDFLIISRGDSTLRGHFPLETEVIKRTLESASSHKYDGEIIFPYFKEGGRYTIDNVHYVQYDNMLVPAGETEFAKDRTFGYLHSHLGDWIEEKSDGKYKTEDITYLSLQDIRNGDVNKLQQQLMAVTNFHKVVVNAVTEEDVKVATLAIVRALQAGQTFLFRTAATFTKIIGGVSDRPLLTKETLIPSASNHGGLIMVGSHVKKTTEQLAALQASVHVTSVLFNSHYVLQPALFQSEIKRVISACETLISEGKTVVVYTNRERLDLGERKEEEELQLSVTISRAVTSIVAALTVRPKYIIAKGGITSSDIGTNGLHVKKATVMGQVKPGIPVWKTGEESKFPGIAYVVFPGNVGETHTLKEIVSLLES